MHWLLQNILLVAGAGLAVLWLQTLRKRGALLEVRERLRRIPGARIAGIVLVVYFGIGYVDLLRIPPSGERLFAVSPIDLIFSAVPKERTYSAPFAASVITAVDEDPNAQENRVSGLHVLGTDVNGYDVLYNVCKGCGVALLLVLGTMLVSFPLGLVLGLAAGYFGGVVDDVVQWLYTTMASIPWLLFVLAFLAVFGRSLLWICVAFGLTSWTELARLIRGETLKLRELNYVRSAKAAGVSPARLIFRHILPNLSHVYIVTFTITASSIVLAESVLTFIGIGVEPGQSSWGRMLVEAQTELVRSPPIWWVFAGASFLGIFPLVLALNVFGDALRDALDPRLDRK